MHRLKLLSLMRYLCKILVIGIENRLSIRSLRRFFCTFAAKISRTNGISKKL